MKRTVNMMNARTQFQRDVMEQIRKDKVCPFCEEHFLRYHNKPILKKGRHWLLTTNFQPYEGSKHHLLAVSRTHVTHFDELSATAQAELFSLFAGEAKKRGIRGGTVFMRFGDTNYTGGTVEHLHAHLVTGAKGGKGRERLLTSISFKTR